MKKIITLLSAFVFCLNAAQGQKPVASFVVDQDTLCGHSYLSFTDQSTNNPTSWSWSFPGAVPLTSTAQNPDSIFYLQGGNYYAILVASNSFGSDTFNLPYTLHTTFSATVHANGSLLWIWQQPINFHWFKDGAPIPGATDTFYNATQNGSYYVRLLPNSGCATWSDTVTISNLKVENTGKDNTINLYPNPNDGDFTLSGLSSSKENTVTVSVTDMTGRLIKNETIPLRNGIFNQVVHIDKSLPAGIYIARFTSSTQHYVVPFEKR